jgi:hypothetical protein
VNPAPQKDRKNLFSHYIELQDILLYPLKPLVHVVGFQGIHQQLLSLTLEGPAAKELKNYRAFNIQSLDFYDAGALVPPAVFSSTSKGDKLRMATSALASELGFLRYSFFKSTVQFKPAVTIMAFDWQQHPGDGTGNFDWRFYEQQVLMEVKQHQDKCPGARQSKIVLLILLPLADQTSNVDEKITSLKRAVAARGDENIRTFFLLTTGFEGLKNIAKKFVKNVNDLAFQYYRERKFHIKKKQGKLIKEQIENVKYSFKHGIYSAFTKSSTDYMTPIKYLKAAYTQLRQSIGNSGARTSFEEKRENADLISLKICQYSLQHANYSGFLEQFRLHFYTFQTKIANLPRERRFEELKWRGNQMRLMNQLLEIYSPGPMQSLSSADVNHSFELFSGFYCLNTMLMAMARKHEFALLMRAAEPIDEKEMQTMNSRTYNLIGKDLVVQDSRDPLGSVTKNPQEQRALLEKFKLYQESKCDVDSIIFEYAQKALLAYKLRA